MKKERFLKIKNKEKSLKGIARIKFLAEELNEEERTAYFEEIRKMEETQKGLILFIKNDLAEFKHNGEDIEEIKIVEDEKDGAYITYKLNGVKYAITNKEE